MINQEYLQQCLNYNPESGIFTWKNRPREHFKTERGFNTFNAQKTGKETGCIGTTDCGMSYRKIRLNKKLYYAHRLAWIYTFGEIPHKMEIDHIDHNGLNNSLSNLRLATSSGNKSNRTMVSTNKSGCMGVYFNKRYGMWCAEIVKDGVRTGLGYYSTYEKAKEVRKVKEIELGFHINHGAMKIDNI